MERRVLKGINAGEDTLAHLNSAAFDKKGAQDPRLCGSIYVNEFTVSRPESATM